MRGFVGLLLLRNTFPNRFAGRAIDGQHEESMHVTRLYTAFASVSIIARGVHWYGCKKENTIAPYDRRGGSAAGNLDLPADVLGLAPFKRWICSRRNACREWASPLCPIAFVSRF